MGDEEVLQSMVKYPSLLASSAQTNCDVPELSTVHIVYAPRPRIYIFFRTRYCMLSYFRQTELKRILERENVSFALSICLTLQDASPDS